MIPTRTLCRVLVVSIALAALLPDGLVGQDYLLTDTATWSDGVGEGSMATLVVDGDPVDVVDLFSGVLVSSVGFLYQPVMDSGSRWEECGRDSVCWTLGPWSFWNREVVTVLSEVAPALHPLLSKPLVRESVIFYVGVEGGGGIYRLSARSFDLLDGTSQVAGDLGSASLESDALNPIGPPRPQGGCILFQLAEPILLNQRLEPC